MRSCAQTVLRIGYLAAAVLTMCKGAAFSTETCRRTLANDQAPFAARSTAAFNLAWIQRVEADHAVELSCLSIGDVRMLHLPGEPFVEYQLAAQRLRPESFVLVAGYGDGGMGYIGGDRIYQDRGGYEQSFAFAGPSQQLLLDAISRLLEGQGDDRYVAASRSSRSPSSRK